MKKIHQINAIPKLSLSYRGKADDKMTLQLIKLSESFIHDNKLLKKLTKKISFLIAESFQNVVRHGTTKPLESELAGEKDFFRISILDDRIIISSSNIIETENIQDLNKKIDDINQLSAEELKEVWRSQMQNGEYSAKGGAGLGIIEMARKSGLPLKKQFVVINEVFSRFYLGVEIPNKKDCTSEKLCVSDLVNSYSDFVNKGVILSYTGNFSGQTNAFLIEMLHNNFVDENNLNSSTIENVTMMIEIIQNVSKHGAVVDNHCYGCFTIREENNEQYIRSNNFVEPKNYLEFKALLEAVKKENSTGLKLGRKKRLLEEELSEEGNGGIGLIEIALFTDNYFEYSFEKTENELYLFSIELKLK